MAFTFEKLDVWVKSKDLVKDVYTLLNQLPATERYALCDQLRRAIVSVPSNIAEGSGRPSTKERVRFTEIAYGSLMESFCQLRLAADLGYIPAESVETIRPKFEEIAKMLSGFRKALLAQS
jgi:four helix bundle protein